MSRDNECRTCSHSWEIHDRHGMKRCFQGMGEDYDSFDQTCDCNTGWIPRNNLEFLEMKYDRSKLAIESSNKSNEDLPNK